MKSNLPLAERMRPKQLSDVLGQDHLVGPNGHLTRSIKSGKIHSFIFWGPPGSGKTTVARLYAQSFPVQFFSLSAVFSGIQEIKQIIQEARSKPLLQRQTVLFVDEIHRFNKAQQDAFLSCLEDGTLALIGATTENPSFSINNALLSRVRVLPFHPLEKESLETLLRSYEKQYSPLPLEPEAHELLLAYASQDARYLLNLIESLESYQEKTILSPKALQSFLQRRSPLFDKQGDGHYNLISALHKSVRGSDPDGSLYWLSRMLEAGEDPLFIARRLIRMAIEDIGLAEPEALKISLAARDAYHMLGSPEGELALAEATVYLALAPKSHALYSAFKKARSLASRTGHLSPPKAILNAPTGLMKRLGYGEGYQYDHDCPQAFSGQDYFPEGIGRQTFFEPVARGFERSLKQRIAYFEQLRKKR